MAIESVPEYRAVMRRIAELMDAEVGTPKGDELTALTDRVVDYEERFFPWT